MDTTRYAPIPKILHQVWLGPFEPPNKWMESWKDFCASYNWVYMLWRESDIEKFGLKNNIHFKDSISYQQKSDIARYEILYRLGGLYVDCDMVWLGHDLEKYIPLNSSNFIGVQEFPSKAMIIIGAPYLSNGFIASSPKHKILERCIEQIPDRVKLQTPNVFVKTGPTLLNKNVKEIISIIPYFLVFPKDFHRKTDTDNPMIYSKTALVFTYNGMEYPHMKRLKQIKDKMNKQEAINNYKK